jgi:hypothetical protein
VNTDQTPPARLTFQQVEWWVATRRLQRKSILNVTIHNDILPDPGTLRKPLTLSNQESTTKRRRTSKSDQNKKDPEKTKPTASPSKPKGGCHGQADHVKKQYY